MTNKDIEYKAKEVADFAYHMTKLWYQIMEDTRLYLAKSTTVKKTKVWSVMDSNTFKRLKSGSLEVCLGYIMEEWVSRKNAKKVKIGKRKTKFNPFDKPIKHHGKVKRVPKKGKG